LGLHLDGDRSVWGSNGAACGAGLGEVIGNRERTFRAYCEFANDLLGCGIHAGLT
jgi:hypothetical protein